MVSAALRLPQSPLSPLFRLLFLPSPLLPSLGLFVFPSTALPHPCLPTPTPMIGAVFPPPPPIDHLERIVEIAQLRAVQRKARFAKLKVCVFKEEMPITPYECTFLNTQRFERSESDGQIFQHHCEVDVSFGPWEAVADVYDLLHCLVTDLSAQGLTVDHQCIGVCDKHLISHYYCKRPIYEFKITWW